MDIIPSLFHSSWHLNLFGDKNFMLIEKCLESFVIDCGYLKYI